MHAIDEVETVTERPQIATQGSAQTDNADSIAQKGRSARRKLNSQTRSSPQNPACYRYRPDRTARCAPPGRALASRAAAPAAAPAAPAPRPDVQIRTEKNTLSVRDSANTPASQRLRWPPREQQRTRQQTQSGTREQVNKSRLSHHAKSRKIHRGTRAGKQNARHEPAAGSAAAPHLRAAAAPAARPPTLRSFREQARDI